MSSLYVSSAAIGGTSSTANALLFRVAFRHGSSRMPSRRRSDGHARRDPITEAIAQRAYELFLARGKQHGHDLDDWLQAERELAEAAKSPLPDAKAPRSQSEEPV
jgi:hypothetical protein